MIIIIFLCLHRHKLESLVSIMAQHTNPLDIIGAYVSAIDKANNIKCMGHLWLGHILLMGRPK